MSTRKDKVQLEVEINGKQGKNEFALLVKEQRKLRKALYDTTLSQEEMIKKSAQYKKVTARLSQVRNEVLGARKETSLWKTAFTRLLPVATAFFAASGITSFLGNIRNLIVGADALEGKFNTVFGNAAAVVKASAEQQAIALGLTKNQYLEAATAAGDLLIPMGFQREEAAKLSTDLIGLSGALANWSNGQFDSKEVSNILTKALLGEREQLKSLGISIQEADVKQRLMDKGMSKLTGTALQQAKAMATLELITEKSTDAQNKFSSGQKSLSQRTAELRAWILQKVETFSTQLIPVYDLLLGVTKRVLETTFIFLGALAQTPKFIKENKVVIAALVLALIALNKNQIAAQYSALKMAVANKRASIATAAQTFSMKALNAAFRANPIGFVITAISFLVAGFDVAYRKSEKFRGTINGLGSVAKEVFKIIKESIQTFLDGFEDIKNGDFKSGLKKIGKSIVDTNPVGLAFTQGKRLGKAFTKGYDESLQAPSDNESELLQQQAQQLEAKGLEIGKNTGQSIIDGINKKLEEQNNQSGSTEVKVPRPLVAKAAAIGNDYTQESLTASASVTAADRIKNIEEGNKVELDLLEKKFLQSIFIEEEYGIKRLELISQSKEEELRLLATFGLTETEQYRNIELEKLRIDKEIGDKRVESKAREQAMIRAIEQQGIEAFREIIDESITLLARDEKAKKRAGRIARAFEAGVVAINSAREISEIFKSTAGWGPLGWVTASVRAVAAGLRATSAISKINAQKFYQGGRVPHYSGQLITGPANIPTQSGGDNILAMLTADEVVLNKRQQAAVGGPDVFRAAGVPGFNTGGIARVNTTPSNAVVTAVTTNNGGAGSRIVSDMRDTLHMLTAVLARGINANVSYTDLKQAESDVNLNQSLAAL